MEEARILPRYRQPPLVRRSRLEAQQAAALAHALDTNPEAVMPRQHMTKPGDARRLRGIPAIGPSVTGAVPGTDPERATINKLTRHAAA